MTDSPPDQVLRFRYAAALEMGLLEEAAELAAEIGVTSADMSEHIAGLREWDHRNPPGRFGELRPAPGRFDRRVFDQRTVWVDVLGRTHRITEMTDDYLMNVIAFIAEHAWKWAPFPELRDEDLLDVQAFKAEAFRRLAHSPLVVALTDEARRRGLELA